MFIFPYRNFEDEIFVRWIECNTPFSEYVLRYVFIFFDHNFQFTFRICFCFVIIYPSVFHWIRIREVRVNPSLNRGPDPCVLLDLVFSLVRFDRFQFQTSFFYILYFSLFSENFQIFFAKSLKLVSISIADRFLDF